MQQKSCTLLKKDAKVAAHMDRKITWIYLLLAGAIVVFACLAYAEYQMFTKTLGR